jgi:hypothetical protein
MAHAFLWSIMHCRVTGRGHIDINRISGYLPGKIVFYLMQVRRKLSSVSVLPNSLWLASRSGRGVAPVTSSPTAPDVCQTRRCLTFTYTCFSSSPRLHATAFFRNCPCCSCPAFDVHFWCPAYAS